MRRCHVLLLAAATLVAPILAGQTPAAPPATIVGDTLLRLDGLGLTPDQISKITAIWQGLRTENAPVRAQMRQLLGGRMFRDLTPAERDSLGPRLAPLRRQLGENRRAAWTQVSALLAPEQRDSVAARLRERREGRPSP